MLAHTRLMRWTRGLAAAALAAAGLLAPGLVRPAYAQTITVTTTAEAPGGGGDCTLGEAIQAANTNAAVDACLAGTSSDVIVLASGQTYTITLVTGDSQSAFIISGTITLQGEGASLVHAPLTTTLRFFTVTASANLTLLDLSLVGGRAAGHNGKASLVAGSPGASGGNGYGGAIYNFGHLVLDGVVFVDNIARGGSGGAGFAGSATSNGGNAGSAFGGAVFSPGSITVTGNGAQLTGSRALGGNGGPGGTPSAGGGNGGSGFGGAIYLSGALEATGGPLIVENSLAQGGNGGTGSLSPMAGDAWGGGLAQASVLPVNLIGADFIGNRALGGSPGSNGVSLGSGGAAIGGAIQTVAALTLTAGSLLSNSATGGSGPSGGDALGGAIYSSLSATTWRHMIVMSNTAEGGTGSSTLGFGGAAAGGGMYKPSGKTDIDQTALVGNAAVGGIDFSSGTTGLGQGGGLMLSNSSAAITNTTLARNRASWQGGGLYGVTSVTSRGSLAYVTVYSNTAITGGGLAGASYLITLTNSLVAYNAGGNCTTTIILAGENMQYPGGSCGLATQDDPLLGSLGDYGGQTLTLPLGAGSPAIDLGDPALCPPTDQRGLPRPAGDGCDLGAFERWLELFLPIVRR